MPENYYTVVFDVNGVRAYTDPFTFESDAERKRDELEQSGAVEDTHVHEYEAADSQQE